MKKIDVSSRYKDTEHWVKKEHDYFLIGITDFTQKVFGNIVLIELPTIGTQLNLDDKYADIESDKTVSELFMPIGGEVIEVNEKLLQQPEQINESPYESWLIKIKAIDFKEYEALDSSKTYSESIHLFFNKKS